MKSNRKTAVAQIERRALRINDAAAAYGLGRSTLYKLMSQGKLATVKIGGRRLVPREVMEAFLAQAR
jgi:excisionase family DNA binding protein